MQCTETDVLCGRGLYGMFTAGITVSENGPHTHVCKAGEGRLVVVSAPAPFL